MAGFNQFLYEMDAIENYFMFLKIHSILVLEFYFASVFSFIIMPKRSKRQ